ncbi:MAG TPA: triose-phosphate isomerase [Candidatus Acetothermia bacterium]|nr:triose-phosphate isomerase [Candidatus Acetothermia bacterium]
MRRPLIAGNWKMHKTAEETERFIKELLPKLENVEDIDVLIIPPYTSLDRAGRLLQGKSLQLGAQDVHYETEGAFTGAISTHMLKACGCSYVLVGHSERRELFGDDDTIVARKLNVALDSDLKAILCVGETLSEHDLVEEKITRQLTQDLTGIDAMTLTKITIAYEPIWAIGTGKTATPEVAQETISMIRRWIASHYDEAAAQGMRILYGGSVKPANAKSLLAQPDIDGALVGGAALVAESFAQIVDAARLQ